MSIFKQCVLYTFIFLLLSFVFIVNVNAKDTSIHAPYTSLLQKYGKGNSVDYSGLNKERKTLQKYLHSLAIISQKEFKSWNTTTQLAYLINLYNAATLELILENYPVKSIRDIGSFIKGPWSLPIVSLFNKKITLDDLEHEIIRKEYNEPRIHVALVCAAKSCPPLRMEAYTGSMLDAQLAEQARIFLSKEPGLRIDAEKNTVYISSIFKWYKKDFSSVQKFIEEYTPHNLKGFSIKYLPYDWSLNDIMPL